MQPDIFIEQMENNILLDVRSPGEFKKGHIPGAINIPLLQDDERSEVGTLYVKESRDVAFHRALEIVGPKLAEFNNQFRTIQNNRSPESPLPFAVYCWRGGMRSNSMAWLMRTCGFDSYILDGGYKAYRNEFRKLTDNQPWMFRMLGGFTGCGKTDVLHRLGESGQQIIDLEALANHRGSAFGRMPEGNQPSSEMFENLLHDALNRMDPTKPVWIEAESCRIGNVQIPEFFFNKMKDAPLYLYEIPFEERIERLCREYGNASQTFLTDAFMHISRRLGAERTQEAIQAVEGGNLARAASIALTYYDKCYNKSLTDQGNPVIHKITMPTDNPAMGAERLISIEL